MIVLLGERARVIVKCEREFGEISTAECEWNQSSNGDARQRYFTPPCSTELERTYRGPRIRHAFNEVVVYIKGQHHR